jgi:hypothetical protein
MIVGQRSILSDRKSDLAVNEKFRFKTGDLMVGPWGLEPQTSSVSRTRSNQLSYGPELGLD